MPFTVPSQIAFPRDFASVTFSLEPIIENFGLCEVIEAESLVVKSVLDIAFVVTRRLLAFRVLSIMI